MQTPILCRRITDTQLHVLLQNCRHPSFATQTPIFWIRWILGNESLSAHRTDTGGAARGWIGARRLVGWSMIGRLRAVPPMKTRELAGRRRECTIAAGEITGSASCSLLLLWWIVEDFTCSANAMEPLTTDTLGGRGHLPTTANNTARPGFKLVDRPHPGR